MTAETLWFVSITLGAIATVSTVLNVRWMCSDIRTLVTQRLGRRGIGCFETDSVFADKIKRATLSMFVNGQGVGENVESFTVLDIWARMKSPLGFLRTPGLSYSWPHAFLVRGLIADYHRSNDPEIVRVLVKYANEFLLRHPLRADEAMDLTTLDQGMTGELFLFLYEVEADEKWAKISHGVANYLLNRARKEGGTVAYRVSGNNSTGLRYVDALPMMCPFLLRYSKVFNNAAALQLAIGQLQEFIDNALGVEGLPFHAFDPVTNMPVGIIGWGRGVGFYASALIDVYCEIATNGEACFNRFSKRISALAKTVFQLQRDDGGWSTLLTNSQAPYDSSSTVLLVYFLLKVQQMELCVSERDRIDVAIQKGVACLRKHTRSNGVLDFVQLECRGLDYMSHQFAPAAYAQGMLLLLFSCTIAKRTSVSFGKVNRQSC